MNRFHKLRSERGHSGEALDEIERDTFGGKNCACAARHAEQARPALDMQAVSHELFELEISGNLVERRDCERETRHDEVFTRYHRGLGDGVLGHGGEGGRVA